MFLNDFIDIRIDIPEMAEVLDRSPTDRPQAREDLHHYDLTNVSRLRVLQTGQTPSGGLQVFPSTSSSRPGMQPTEQSPSASAQLYQTPSRRPIPDLSAQDHPKTPTLSAHPTPMTPETPNTKVEPPEVESAQKAQKRGQIEPQTDAHQRNQQVCCRVCESPTQTFVKHTLCCGESLCYRCWDRFYVPHVQEARSCPYC